MQNHKSGALVIFVKTPGLSPVKTRLARSIGKEDAEQFHLLSAKAIESVVARAVGEVCGLVPYWAVAEEQALHCPQWAGFGNIWQGDGSLGEKLARTYDNLIKRHSFVLLMGADSPQVTAKLLSEGALVLTESEKVTFTIGPAIDGGFYLFGGNRPIPHSVWMDVPYSESTTASRLTSLVAQLGDLRALRTLVDVDTSEDLKTLLRELESQKELTPEQLAIQSWVSAVLGRGKENNESTS